MCGETRCLLIGGGSREDAIGEALDNSRNTELFVISSNPNPGLARKAKKLVIHSIQDTVWIAEWAVQQNIGLAVIGPEVPLEVGLPDTLIKSGIPTVGPTQKSARLETSKLFLRNLMRQYGIPGRVDYHYFEDTNELGRFLLHSDSQYALKPIGLTSGKGVKVMGIQLASREEALAYGQSVIETRIGGTAGILVEERLIGKEFTLQAFVDGKNLVPMPLVKDYKLAFEGDKGPNTGSMGSYSQANGLLPYVSLETKEMALEILRHIVRAMMAESLVYKGVMYGQFCMTNQGPKLIEVNARFGDPEAANVLPLLETSFVEVCEAIVDGRLGKIQVEFSPKATVCKYITPPGYPENPNIGVPISLNYEAIQALGVRIYYAHVSGEDRNAVFTTKSRSIALVGIGDSVAEAETKVEEALQYLKGNYHLRHDIGKGINE